MHLIAPLMTGIRGGKNGTVFAYERGTETPAPVYADASGKVRRYGALRLDALGSMALYVDRLVDVTVRDADGELVRAWTDGRSEGAVVVESDTFTGVDDVTGVSGVGERTTMDEVFERLYTSSGAVDWNVMAGQVVRPVYMAFGDVAGPFYDVRRFGTRGDGTGDDTVAIQAAIDAAHVGGGGVVFLPAGTYRTSDFLVLYDSVSLVGDGCVCVGLVSTNEAVVSLYVFGSDDPAQTFTRTHTIQGITFGSDYSSGGLTSEAFVEVQAGSVVIKDCRFWGSASSGNLLSIGTSERVRVAECDFLLFQPSSSAISTLLGNPERVNVDNCIFRVMSLTRTAGAGMVGISKLHMEGCSFFAGTASGDSEAIVLAGDVNAFVDGCDFGDNYEGPGTQTLLACGNLSDSFERLFEDCSLFPAVGAFKLCTLADAGAGGTYYSRLKTVEARVAPPVEDTMPVNSGLYHAIATDASQYGVFSFYNKSAVAVAAPESTLFIGSPTFGSYSTNMNGARTIDFLFFCVTQEGFNIVENRHRNSVVPRWNFKANSLFAFRMIHARALATAPSAGDMTRLHCLSCSASAATVVAGEREGYGPI